MILLHGVATNCRRAAEGPADVDWSEPDKGRGVFTKSAFRDGFSLWLELADEGTIVAILCGENMESHNDEEDAMRWPLFTWILAGGIFGMFWFVYLSIKQHETHWRPVATYARRRRSHQHRDRTIANA
jgi:hypothetical protein